MIHDRDNVFDKMHWRCQPRSPKHRQPLRSRFRAVLECRIEGAFQGASPFFETRNPMLVPRTAPQSLELTPGVRNT
ncbi:hypothetical protein CH289_03790 [Rhodococcus sp. RS1C4]|nr:hypothetical protein CH289_03790 [Rhodococcus sp. RS1C4]OZE78071.1 hypothetical protein CH304_22535 [Rhodococcus sp. 15-649-1-2]